MKLFYIAGKYSAPTIREVVLNIRKAEEVALRYWKLGAVICPHTNTALMDGELSWEHVLEGDFEIIKRCDAVVFMKDWENSKGAVLEHQLAIKEGKEIIYE